MMKGTVKTFFDEKRFGFIVADDGQEYFVHQTAITDGSSLKEGDVVNFDPEKGDKGLKAANVSKADATESNESATASDESSDDSSEDKKE